MGDVVLDGCRSEPLGSYLEALGVFRLVAEQLDPGVTARWADDRLVLTTSWSLDQIVDFFVDAYRPTPVVSPWNGGSGFHPKDNVEGIDAVEASRTSRLAVFRSAIGVARKLVVDDRWSTSTKESQVRLCRNELPDEAVPWLDAAVVLSESGAVFPPILGTGGNVGRLDFSNNFMQQVANVLCLRDGRGAPDRDRSMAWLSAALGMGGDLAGATLVKKAVGQFDPGAAGGTNAPWGGVEESLVNPWGYVLTIEGALLFASGAARRMGAGAQGKAAMPFTFDASPVGYGSAADGESAKGELWAPLWHRPASLAEVGRLLGEGRADWNGGQARRGVDVARAATSLGVDRGIDTFVRHAFVERMGQAMLAVPVGRVAVAAARRDDVPALAEIDAWVDRLRRVKNLAAGPARLLRRLDEAVFDLATTPASGPRPQRLQDVLVVLAELDRAVARSTTLRDAVEPLGNRGRRAAGSPWRIPLAAARWWPLLDDGTVELRLARALASGRVPKPGDPVDVGEPPAGSVVPEWPATLLRGVVPEPGANGTWRLAWRPGGRPLVPGLGTDGLVDLIGAFVRRRAADAGMRRDDARSGPRAEPVADLEAGEVEGVDAAGAGGQIGVDPSYPVRDPASLADVLDLVDAAVDETRLERLLSALLLLRFGGKVVLPVAGEPVRRVVHPAVALVLPFFHGRPLELDGVPVRLRAGSAWPRLLAAGRVEEVVTDAVHRPQVARLVPLVSDARALAEGVDGPRLLAAGAFPLSDGGARDLLRRVAVTDPALTIDPQEEP